MPLLFLNTDKALLPYSKNTDLVKLVHAQSVNASPLPLDGLQEGLQIPKLYRNETRIVCGQEDSVRAVQIKCKLS